LSTHRIAGFLGRAVVGTVSVEGAAGKRVVQVRMGPFFRANVPLEQITAAEVGRPSQWAGVGVHGSKGSWVVNGRMGETAVVEIDPPVRGWVCSLPCRVHRLALGVTDPEPLVAELDAELAKRQP
jgi:hypothetical protein